MTSLTQKAAILAIGVWGSAQAAHDGELGGQTQGGSRGDFTITMSQEGVARVFGLKDFTISPSSLSSSAPICIYTNTENVTIKATSGNNKFELQDDQSIAGASYSLELFDSNSTDGGTAKKKWGEGGDSADVDVPKRALAGSDDERTNVCNTGNYSLKVNASLKKGVKQGSYTDTVTLLVTPQ